MSDHLLNERASLSRDPSPCILHTRKLRPGGETGPALGRNWGRACSLLSPCLSCPRDQDSRTCGDTAPSYLVLPLEGNTGSWAAPACPGGQRPVSRNLPWWLSAGVRTEPDPKGAHHRRGQMEPPRAGAGIRNQSKTPQGLRPVLPLRGIRQWEQRGPTLPQCGGGEGHSQGAQVQDSEQGPDAKTCSPPITPGCMAVESVRPLPTHPPPRGERHSLPPAGL